MPYGMLCHRRADVDLEYWEEIWALYAGGEDLLRRPAVLKRLFPQHTAEDPEIYSERRARAGYTNYAGATVDYVVAGLMADPVKPEVKGADASFWEGWVEDLSAPRGKAMSLSELLACHVRNALLFKSAWTLVDLPDVGPELEPRSLGEQEAAGALNVYAKPIDPRCVMDWEQSDDGELEWVLLRFRDVRRSSLMRPRVRVVERFYLYTPGDWTLFLVEYDDPELCKEYRITPEKGYEKPGDDALIDGKSSRHTIGRVPLIHTEIKDGLWMMNKIHSLAKRHFNRENAHDWALLKALFPVLYEFLGPEIPGIDSPVPEQQQDPDRAVKQPRGIGYIQTRGADDDARYVGPETSAFDHALEALKALRDELHRVVYQLALATENSKASVLRSGGLRDRDARLRRRRVRGGLPGGAGLRGRVRPGLTHRPSGPRPGARVREHPERHLPAQSEGPGRPAHGRRRLHRGGAPGHRLRARRVDHAGPISGARPRAAAIRGDR